MSRSGGLTSQEDARPGRLPRQAETPHARKLGGEAATKTGQVYCRDRESEGPPLEIKATVRSPCSAGTRGWEAWAPAPHCAKSAVLPLRPVPDSGRPLCRRGAGLPGVNRPPIPELGWGGVPPTPGAGPTPGRGRWVSSSRFPPTPGRCLQGRSPLAEEPAQWGVAAVSAPLQGCTLSPPRTPGRCAWRTATASARTGCCAPQRAAPRPPR